MTNVETQKDIYEDDQDDPNEELQELSLGIDLVNQLQDMFKDEYYIGQKVKTRQNTKIFIPRSLAKQLFMIWMESAYNQMEEDNQKMLREDEYFARLLKNPEYQNFMQTPNNIHELLDEIRCGIDQDDQISDIENYDYNDNVQSKNLAEHLTEFKLCEKFPYIPKDTINDVLIAHNNDYAQTLKALKSTIGTNTDLETETEPDDSPKISYTVNRKH